MQLLRYFNGSEWSLGIVSEYGVLSIRNGLMRLRSAGRLSAVSEDVIDRVSSDGKTLLLCLPALRAALELLTEGNVDAILVARSPGELAIGPFIPNPEKVLGVSYNYAALAVQAGGTTSKNPVVFAKMPSSVSGAFDGITVPPGLEHIDFEAELGVVIGSVARHADVEEARSCIGAYTVVNDMTAKILPRPKLDLATIVPPLKAIDNFAPVGAVVVTPDEFVDFAELVVRCRVNGEERQCYAAGDWHHDPAEVVSFISSFVTLQPGDLVAMGTSEGIGIAEMPPRLLRDGDVVEVEFGGYLGTRNTVHMPSMDKESQ